MEDFAKIVNFGPVQGPYQKFFARSIFRPQCKLPLKVNLVLFFSDQNTDGLDNWSSWFRRGVVKLLEIASDKAEARTLKALEMDEVYTAHIQNVIFKMMTRLSSGRKKKKLIELD